MTDKNESFEELFMSQDLISGDELEWEWEEEHMAFVAVDRVGRRYILTPTAGSMVTDDSEIEIDEEEEWE